MAFGLVAVDLKTQMMRKGEHEGKCGSEDETRLKSLEIETHQLQEALKRKQGLLIASHPSPIY